MLLKSILSLFLYIFRKITLDYKFLRKKDKLLVLVFHKVSDSKSAYHSPMPINTYNKICLFIKKHYNVIHFSEVDEYYSSKVYPKAAAIVTFDDGLIDIKDNVMPFMNKHSIKFNINLDTEILETNLPQDFLKIYDILNATKPIKYMDPKYMVTPILIYKRKPIDVETDFTFILSNLTSNARREFVQRMANNLGMHSDYYGVVSISDLKKWSNNPNIEFGSHTHTHPDLTRISTDSVTKELMQSKRILSLNLDKEIEIIAYPNGQSNASIDNLSKEIGYKYLLKSEDTYTSFEDIKKGHFYRVNQYHPSFEIGIAHTLGLFKLIKKHLYGKV